MFIKNPYGKHKKFRLFAGTKTVRLPELDAINKEFLANNYTFEQARELVEKLRDQKDRDKPSSFLPENQRLMENYKKDILDFKGNRAPIAAYDRVKRTIKRLGATPVLGSTREQLLTALSGVEQNSRRDSISVINSLLKFKGVPIRLPLPKKLKNEITYLTLEEFNLVLQALEKVEDKLYCQAAFGTGARYGEVMDFTSSALRDEGKHIWVASQRKRDWKRSNVTKNEKFGDVFIMPEFRLAVKQWILVPVDVKQKMRKSGAPLKEFKKACRKALGRTDLTLHSLRHSYANEMLGRGATLTELKQWMRDSIRVIEEFYVSMVRTSEERANSVKKFG